MYLKQPTGQDCENGALVIYDGNSTSATVLERLCGWRASKTYFSNSNAVVLRLEDLALDLDEGIVIKYESLGKCLNKWICMH